MRIVYCIHIHVEDGLYMNPEEQITQVVGYRGFMPVTEQKLNKSSYVDSYS